VIGVGAEDDFLLNECHDAQHQASRDGRVKRR
jgi:hypothetical protein